nr:lysine-specific demethylase 5D isoform X1 [Tanacetum cinerariifolium]
MPLCRLVLISLFSATFRVAFEFDLSASRLNSIGLGDGVCGSSHSPFDLSWLNHITSKAKKVSADSGALELHKVFELIAEGENSPVHFDKELKLLQERSMLYCICRKPYDQRAMIACDKCEDLSVVVRKLSNALKAVEVAGVYERESNGKFELALARNSWRVRASKLLNSSQKPSVNQIQRLLKEGLTMNVPLEDYIWHRLETIKEKGLQWAAKAKKVSADSGALELHKVFELIAEGENSPVHFDKELKVRT